MKVITLILIIFSALSNGNSQSFDLKKNHKIDSIITKYAKEYSIVGLSLGIIHGQKSITKHYGNTDLTNTYPIMDSSMFHIASISKLFTATAIMQLVEKDLLSLDDPLIKILPDFSMKDSRYSKITIKHLLTHSSGLMWNNKLKQSPDDTSSSFLYIKNLQNKKLNFEPGEKLSYDTYSNVGYDILGIVVEKIVDQSFDEYVYKNILSPLNMKQSTYYYENISKANLAIPQIVAGNSNKVKRLNFFGIDNKKKPIINGTPLSLKSYDIYGEDYEHNHSGNLIASAHELTLWMKHHLELYSNTTNTGILKSSTLRKMWTTQKEIPSSNTSIGCGWWIHQDEEFGKSVFHAGNNPGFCSILILYPEKDFGITVLCNGWYAQEAVWNKITEEISQLFISSN